MVRAMLYEVAKNKIKKNSVILDHALLGAQAMGISSRQAPGAKRAKVVARKIGVIRHRMWIDGTTTRWTTNAKAAGQAETVRTSEPIVAGWAL